MIRKFQVVNFKNLGRWMDGWMGGWMEGWKDGRMEGWKDGWKLKRG